jgi:hypothetical protein
MHEPSVAALKIAKGNDGANASPWILSTVSHSGQGPYFTFSLSTPPKLTRMFTAACNCHCHTVADSIGDDTIVSSIDSADNSFTTLKRLVNDRPDLQKLVAELQRLKDTALEATGRARQWMVRQSLGQWAEWLV